MPSSLLPSGRRMSGRALARATRLAVAAVVAFSNVAGAVVVYVLSALVLPGLEPADERAAEITNAAAGTAYLVFAVVAGLLLGLRYARPVLDWLGHDRDPDEREQRRALRVPLVVLAYQASLWLLAAVLFAVMNAVAFDVGLGVRVGLVVALGGITTSAIAYLLIERGLRPVAIRALAPGSPPRLVAPGVAVRFVLAWSLGTAVPVLGVLIIGIAQLADQDATPRQLALTMVVLSGVALVVGLLAILVTAHAVAGPVRAVGRAVRAIERGDLEVHVRVDDGSELGRLQAGVNRMVVGLRERERLRDLFGRHVGEDVARAALDRGIELGGEVRDVAVLFVDVVDSTRMAAERPPQEVVELLNRFFDVIIDTVGRHGGWINKFEGDAALAVFGVPAPLADHAACALAAARDIGRRLAAEVPELAAGVGVSGGECVAGNVGSTERFEYTVIGDPVNEAARLSDAAKDAPGRVLAAVRLVEQAGDEARHWREAGTRRLRGRDEATRVAVPA